MDLHEASSVSGSSQQSVMDSSVGVVYSENQRSKALTNAIYYFALTLWSTLTSSSPGKLDEQSINHLPMEARVVSRSAGQSNALDTKMKRDILKEMMCRVVTPDEALRFDGAAEEFEKYELPMLREAFKFLREYTIKVNCMNVDCCRFSELILFSPTQLLIMFYHREKAQSFG